MLFKLKNKYLLARTVRPLVRQYLIYDSRVFRVLYYVNTVTPDLSSEVYPSAIRKIRIILRHNSFKFWQATTEKDNSDNILRARGNTYQKRTIVYVVFQLLHVGSRLHVLPLIAILAPW